MCFFSDFYFASLRCFLFPRGTLYTQHKHKKPPQLQPCNGRWLNGGGIWGVRPSGFTREGLRMHRATCAVVGSESLPTHAGRLLVWYGVSPLKNRGYSSFSARRPHQVHLDRMALIPPNALPTLRSGRRGPLRGPHPPGVRPRTRGCPRGGDIRLPPRTDSAGGVGGLPQTHCSNTHIYRCGCAA